jgi:hypothetical protein
MQPLYSVLPHTSPCQDWAQAPLIPRPVLSGVFAASVLIALTYAASPALVAHRQAGDFKVHVQARSEE